MPSTIDMLRARIRSIKLPLQNASSKEKEGPASTAIAQIFTFVNEMTPRPQVPRQAIESFVLLIAPFAPHIAEELWARLGHDASLAYEAWPRYDPELAKDDEIEIALQVMGKVKSRVTVPADIDDRALREIALGDARVQAAVASKKVRKVIVVKGRLVNIVAN